MNGADRLRRHLEAQHGVVVRPATAHDLLEVVCHSEHSARVAVRGLNGFGLPVTRRVSVSELRLALQE